MNIPPKYEDVVANLDAALAREAALREELATSREAFKEELEGVKYTRRKFRQERDALQQRLTAAEQRADLLEGLLKSGSSPTYAHCSAVMEALKPAAEPDHICEGCGSKGWTANCAQCVPY